MQHIFGARIVKLRFNKWRKYRGRQPTLDPQELQWPTLEAQRDQSSLLFYHKIHCGTVSIDKDKYLVRLREQDLTGHHTIHSIEGTRLIVMP